MVDQPGRAESHGGAVSRAGHPGTRRLLYWAAGLSLGALVAHAIDAPDHLAEWWGYSAFFVTAAAFQFFYGVGLFLQPWRYDDTGGQRADPERYGRPYYLLGIVLTGLVLAIYAASRTTGMPFFGPDAAAEPITTLSLVPVGESVPLLYCLARLYIAARGPDGRDAGEPINRPGDDPPAVRLQL